MKAQFKYAFRAGISLRLPVFAAILAMNIVFIALGLLFRLPEAAHITFVALSGTALAAMMAVNVVGDISILNRIFAAPDAYLHALTPAPRQQILLASIVAMLVMDLVTTGALIGGVVWLAANFDAAYGSQTPFMTELGYEPFVMTLEFLQNTALLIAGYLLIVMTVIFCVSMRKSLFYQKRGGGWLTALLALGVAYAVSLSSLLLAPFGDVERQGIFFTVTPNGLGNVLYILLILLEAAALFVLTSKLLERRINI